MATTNFRLHRLKGCIVAEGASQNFTCELVLVENSGELMNVAVVSFGALKKETACVFPVDGVVVNPRQYCCDVCAFYENWRSDVWSDLYKAGKNGL